MRVQTFLNVHKGFEELENWNVFKRLKYEKSVNLWNLTSLKSCWNLKVLKRLEFQTFVDEWKFSSLEMFGISNAYKGFCFEKLGKALFFKGLGFETLDIWNVYKALIYEAFIKARRLGVAKFESARHLLHGIMLFSRVNVIFMFNNEF